MNSGVPKREKSSENAAAARTPFTAPPSSRLVLGSVVHRVRGLHGAPALSPLAGAGEPVTEPP